MQINKKKTTIMLIVIYIIILTAVAVGYFLLSKNLFNNYAKTYSSQNQETNSQNLNEVIKTEYEYYLNNDSLSNVIDEGVVIDKIVEYDGVTVNLINNNLDIYNIAIKDNYLFLINNQEFGVLRFDEILNRNLLPSKANNVMIMDNTGLIYFNSKNTTTTLSNYLDGDTSKYINNYFSQNKNGVIKDKVSGKDVFLSFHKLDDYKNLYIVESFYAADIIPLYKEYSIIFMMFILLYTVLIIGTQIYIFRSIHIENAEIEKYKVRYFYSKPYIIKINFKGKIKKVNRKIKRELQDINKIKDIKELRLADHVSSKTAMDYILKEAGFTVLFGEKQIRFIPLKYSFGYHLIGEEVTDLEEQNKELRKITYFNDVTGQPNIHYFKADLISYINSESFDAKKTTIIKFDVSRFSFINKVFGRKISDIVLCQINEYLNELVKPLNGSLYNTREDKFVIFLKDNKENVESLINNVFKTLEKPLEIKYNKINVNLNAGVYYFQDKDKNPEEIDNIIKAVTLALNKAKASSVSNYIIYDDELKDFETRENIMLKDLIQAIDNKEIAVYLQPQYDNHKKAIIGFEALARWENPKYLNLSPLQYISLAEENNLIIPLGKTIMEKTFLLAQKLEKYNVTISMNISPAQLAQDGFVNEFLEMYNSYNLKKGSIAIEVTETFIISSLEETNKKLKILKDNGITIKLDDFGMGYSSLSYLRDLNIDSVKIDQAFVRHLETDKHDREIVKMIIGLVTSLGYDIIAEGVEDDYQNNFLYKNGCDVVQGFILSKAVPYEEVLQLLKDYNIDKTKSLNVKKRKRVLL